MVLGNCNGSKSYSTFLVSSPNSLLDDIEKLHGYSPRKRTFDQWASADLLRVPPNLIFEIDDAEDEWLYVSSLAQSIL